MRERLRNAWHVFCVLLLGELEVPMVQQKRDAWARHAKKEAPGGQSTAQ